jgi:hypothetical protein
MGTLNGAYAVDDAFRVSCIEGLEFREQRLYLFPLALCLGELGCSGQRAGTLPSGFVHVDGKLQSRRRSGRASRLFDGSQLSLPLHLEPSEVRGAKTGVLGHLTTPSVVSILLYVGTRSLFVISNTSRTFCANNTGVNGFSKKNIPSCKTP